jgi:hypothetical protein
LPGTSVTFCRGPSRSSHDRAGREFSRQRQVDEIAGDRDVIGRVRLDVVNDPLEHRGQVKAAALAMPVDEAAEPLAHELERVGPRQRRKMRIREMRQDKHPWDHRRSDGSQGPFTTPTRSVRARLDFTCDRIVF